MIRAYWIPILFAALIACGTQKTVQQSPEALAGEWKLQRITEDNVSTLLKPLTLNFNTAENGISGYAGCNRYFSTYRTHDSSIKFSAIGSTKMFCENGMAIEDKFLLTLAGIESFKIEGGKLTLFDDGKSVLEFVQ
jgi:heat shock protein HslJ